MHSKHNNDNATTNQLHLRFKEILFFDEYFSKKEFNRGLSVLETYLLLNKFPCYQKIEFVIWRIIYNVVDNWWIKVL